ncbi:sulfatase-like hydrolase/transferase [Saccharothrix australiensis]|uniref:Arylsulfatase A-like enzyme n=1 Tax=Saccharothrix australiensis TaxID=2072 RepID=A0A495VX55_9PSEU|nr:sulfatase-like hydrolase/transferase [Saccharothrix australiensis]RKT53829.1 arylsulfatase A-like enzyme [Saccharothrix australiensis]
MSPLPEYDHVVFISIDTLRSDCIGANPHKLWPRKYPGLRAPATPALDRLAESGAFFLNTISAAPYTAASHGSLFTGHYPLRHGLYEFYNGRLGSPSIFTFGKEDGRRTILKVDFPIILGPELGFTRDVDVYLREDDDEFIEQVVDAERSVSCAHFGGVHLPYGFHNLRFGGDAYRAKVAELEAALPADLPIPTDQITETVREPEDQELFLRYKRVTNHLYATGAYDALFQLYLDGVEFFLRERFEPFLERLRARLEAVGASMLLVVFGDHGHELDADSYGHHNSLSEGVLRVPLLVSGPGIQPGRYAERVRTVDVVPTVVDLLGLDVSRHGGFDGESLADVLLGRAAPEGHRPALSQSYGADTREFVAFQRRQLRGEEPGTLRHVLLGESAHLGSRRVVAMHHRYGPEFRIVPVDEKWVESFGPDLVPVVRPDADAAELLAALDSYNATRKPAEDVPADESLRNQLRSLGYHI